MNKNVFSEEWLTKFMGAFKEEGINLLDIIEDKLLLLEVLENRYNMLLSKLSPENIVELFEKEKEIGLKLIAKEVIDVKWLIFEAENIFRLPHVRAIK